ncbi:MULTISPECIES: TonB-dependent receptor plug domain-containing protein [Kordiimonas]|jgi:outer membrane receptor protein involved in Fe transport|uniref:TonB-dependent receptor plug domain-containing protein n=1 Tax=Kordiimonas TaxID=288021 RepID=UPI0025797122|nr:TonB-dependent receptor [Kordiimonas sp. UBA4487]
MTSQKFATKAVVRPSITRLLSSTALAATLMAAPSFAQDADQNTAQDADEELQLEEISITGSRIKRTGISTPTPTTILNSENIELTGARNVIDVINELPQLGLSFSNESTSFSFGNAGLNFGDLRNLGAKRTLSLVDGRRSVGVPDDENFLSFDVTTLPPELIERIEVITGGASAVYGADAVSGVINYILKDDYEGVTVTAQAGTSDEGDSENYSTSITAGGNFDGGKGNAVVSFEYSDSNGLFYRDRDQAISGLFFVGNPEDTGEGDGIPSQVALDGHRYINFGVPNATIWGPDWSIYSFNEDGTPFQAVPVDQIVDWYATRSDFGGIPGYTDRARIPVNRYNGFAKLRYDLSDNVRLKLQTRYSRTEANDTIGPAFAINAGIDTVSADNPFVTDELRALLGGAESFTFSRQFNEFGPRQSDIEREFFAITGGVEGTFAEGWSWDVFYQWGGTTTTNTNRNDRLDARYEQALDAIIDPDSGEVVCRDQSNGCAPLNPFGPEGTVSQAAVDFVTTDHTTLTRNEQQLLSASVTGPIFDLPAGEVQVALGAEYRKDMLDFKPSWVWQEAAGFFASQFSPVKASNSVKEAFAEVLVPVVKDVPFAKEINLEAAIRLADYEYAGSNTSWKLGGDWQVIDDIRFRAVYARAVRAPALGELFNPGSRGASSLSDPCDALNVNENANRAANCAALGIPDDFIAQTRSVTTLVFSTGNENLDVEKADTLTLGVVLTPRFVPGLTVTADYFDIDLKGGITRFGAQNTLDNCVDLPSLDNGFCDAVSRGADGNIQEVLDTFINASGFRTKGVDFEVNYGFNLDDTVGVPGDLSFKVLGSYLDSYTFLQVADADDAVADQQAGETWNPNWRVNLDTTYRNGALTVNWQTRFTDSMRNSNTADAEFYSISKVPAQWRHDLQVNYQWNDRVGLYAGVDNVFDKMPPLHPWSYRGNGFYSLVGRYVYAGVRIRLQ